MTAPEPQPSPRPRVVLWGTCDTGKPRVRILRDGLRANGIDVIECQSDVWRGIDDKSQVKGLARWLRLLAGIVCAYPTLIWQYLRLPRHDWVLLGYPAIPDIFVIRLFAWLRGSRVAMDWFLSAYDTVVLDRRLVRMWHPLAWGLWIGEWLGVHLADVVFMDTRAHAARMEALFRLRPGCCQAVWVGAEDLFFHSGGSRPVHSPDQPRRILFYGQFIPLHGVATIIEAARLLRDQPVEWVLIGRGQEGERIRAMLEQQPLPRLRWIDWVDYDQLQKHIHEADACLGIFGTSDKAASVIPNKVFQVLASGRPVITRDSPAERELEAIVGALAARVPPGDPAALARAILALSNDGEASTTADMAAAFAPPAIGRQCMAVLGLTTR